MVMGFTRRFLLQLLAGTPALAAMPVSWKFHHNSIAPCSCHRHPIPGVIDGRIVLGAGAKHCSCDYSHEGFCMRCRDYRFKP